MQQLERELGTVRRKLILKSENFKFSKYNYQGFKYTTMLIDKRKVKSARKKWVRLAPIL